MNLSGESPSMERSIRETLLANLQESLAQQLTQEDCFTPNQVQACLTLLQGKLPDVTSILNALEDPEQGANNG